jgi:putative nucleotidyltransferase with HDIG domain
MSRDRWRSFLIVGGFLVITAAHALIGRGTHALHVVHVVFGALYLLPIVAAAIWLGGKPAFALTVASAVAYVIHARVGGAWDQMNGVNHLAMAGVYFFVGGVSAALVRVAERERLARQEAERTAQREALVQGIASLSNALRQRDDGTGLHCDRVARIAVEIGRTLGLSAARLDLLRLAALAHDVGKIGVRDDVLLKPEELTPEERARIERHPAIAAEILRHLHGSEELAEIVLSHHECPDGSGYPRHLAAGEISAEARVLRVADVFAALVEPRPYKLPMTPAEAVARMRTLRGKLDVPSLDALEGILSTGAGPLATPTPGLAHPRPSEGARSAE